MNKPRPRKIEKNLNSSDSLNQARYERAFSNGGRVVRSQKKRSSLPLFLGIFALMVLLVLVVAGLYIQSGLKGGKPGGIPVTVVVEKGSSINTIASQLYDEGVISSVFFFKAAAKMSGSDQKLKAGTFKLAENMPHDELLKLLEKGQSAESTRVTIREGLTVEQTGALLAEKLGFDAAEFVRLADTSASEFSAKYPFLEGAYENSMEGYLFPDTYDFKKGVSPKEAIERMLDQYAKVWSEVGSAQGKAAKANMSQAEIMTIASLIEKETKIVTERELVSSVIYNRLDKNMKLQLCSSVQFLLPDGESRNKLRLTNADIATPSPYNTYLHEGLPPAPIANPGRAAIEAALKPSNDGYIYFVLTGKDGSQTFAANEADFAKAKAKSKEVFGK